MALKATIFANIFFGVFKFYDEWTFHSLLTEYRNSVFITLDTGHLDVNKETHKQELYASQSTREPEISSCNENTPSASSVRTTTNQGTEFEATLKPEPPDAHFTDPDFDFT